MLDKFGDLGKDLAGLVGKAQHAPLLSSALWGSAVDLPLCLARYLPRTMIRHKVTKTTTATTPPIKAWSVPCCPKAFGSDERRRERGAMRVRLGDGARAVEQRQKAGETKQSKQERLFVGRSRSNEPLSLPSLFPPCSRSEAVGE